MGKGALQVYGRKEEDISLPGDPLFFCAWGHPGF